MGRQRYGLFGEVEGFPVLPLLHANVGKIRANLRIAPGAHFQTRAQAGLGLFEFALVEQEAPEVLPGWSNCSDFDGLLEQYFSALEVLYLL